jgi:hypothetical protein
VYVPGELEVTAVRARSGDVIEERVERRTEVWEGAAAVPPAAPAPPPAPAARGSGVSPVIVQADPPVEVVKTTVVRDVSPTHTYTASSYDTSTSYDTYTTTTTTTTSNNSTTATPVIVEARPREESARVPVGPVVLAASASGSGSAHHRRHHRSRSRGGELVRAERLSTGELVLFEEQVEQIQEPARGAGVRIERDRRGRLSISVPKYPR